MTRRLVRITVLAAALAGCAHSEDAAQSATHAQAPTEARAEVVAAGAPAHIAVHGDGAIPPVGDRLTLSEEEWRRRLTPEQFHVLREQGTEAAFSGAYWRTTGERGVYFCAACGAPLFESTANFDSGTGWPSFYQPLEGRVASESDGSLGMVRTEVHCARCGGHLGHVFDDGPPPTGLRYCIDSISLQFHSE